MIIFVRALLLLMLLSLPANAQEGVIPLEVDQGQDRAIAKRIENILGQLESYAAVDVEVVSGVVTLRGEILDADGFDDIVMGRDDGETYIVYGGHHFNIGD